MKFRYLLLLLMFLVNSAFAQNADYDINASAIPPGHGGHQSYTVAAWNILPNTPSAVSRSCCVYLVVGNVPYLYQFGGGNANNELRRVARLNLLTNTWTNNYSTMPFSISSGTALAFRGDSVVFVVGGNLPTLGKTLRYNVYSNNWTVMADMRTKVTDALVLKYGNDHFYVIGGGDGYFGSNALKTNVVQLYTLSTNNYVNIGTFPMPCAMMGGGIYMDTIVSVGGYTTGGTAVSNCYKGFITASSYAISWVPIDPYPAGPIVRLASYLSVVGSGKGIMCTGGAVNGITPVASTYLWNFCTQNWQNGLPDNNLARSNYKACGRGDGVIYSTAGFTTVGVGTTEKLTFNFIDGPCNMSGVTGNSSVIPDKVFLDQNYPNPFNPSTKIRFGIPKSGEVRFVVSDLTGKTILEFNRNYSLAGNYYLDFDGSNLSSGVYFYMLVMGDYSVTKKMLLIK